MDNATLYSQDAESAVLGAVLLDPESFYLVSEVIKPRDFYFSQNRKIFEAMEFIADASKEIDLFVVSDILEQKQSGDGWMPILATLAKNATGSANAKEYAKAVKDYSTMRRLYYATEQAQNITRDKMRSLPERLEAFRDSVALLLADDEQSETGPASISDKLPEFLEHLDNCGKSDDGVTGLRTGFDSMDDRTGGFQDGDLIVIAGRPSMGKTQLALNIASNVALNQSKPILYFSLEMTTPQLIGRVVANYADIEYNRVRKAQFDDLDKNNLRIACDRLDRNQELIIDDSYSLNVSQIVSRARRIQRKTPLAAIVVDHIGLVETEGENESVALSKVTRALKMLAKALNLPVVAVSQLNRQCELRPDKRPVMADLRASGAIEQDADVIMFVYRDAIYHEETPHPNIAELIYRKVRAGEVGTDYLETQFEFSRFKDSTKPEGYQKTFKQKYTKGDNGL